MSNFGDDSPPSLAGPGGPAVSGTPSDPRGPLNLPAILMMVVAGVGGLFTLLSLVQALITSPEDVERAMRQAESAMRQLGIKIPLESRDLTRGLMGQSRAVNVISSLFQGAMCALMFWGGLCMYRGKQYTWAMVGAVVAAIPCCVGQCCCLSMPIGIWSLLVLSRPEVKALFSDVRA